MDKAYDLKKKKKKKSTLYVKYNYACSANLSLMFTLNGYSFCQYCY